MFFRKAAIRKIPQWAIVDQFAIERAEASLNADSPTLQDRLDRLFRAFGQDQPALSDYLSEEISELDHELSQSLGYFLIAAIFRVFTEAFPERLDEVDETALRIAVETLAADEALRADDPLEILESDDLVAMNQPELVDFVQGHLRDAFDQAEDEVPIEELDRVYRAALVEIIALSHAVISPDGVSGPPTELLH